MQKRLAVLNDVPTLVELRKKQLIDEGLPPGSLQMDIDRELAYVYQA